MAQPVPLALSLTPWTPSQQLVVAYSHRLLPMTQAATLDEWRTNVS